MVNYNNYSSNYSESGFWNKILSCAGKAGREIVKNALVLYYALPYTSAQKKALIIGALGYLILPIDLVPDFIPVVGFGDDAAALLAALKTAKTSATPEVYAQAERKLKELFG